MHYEITLVINQHRHHQHEHILILWLLRRQYESSTTGVGQLDDDFLTVKVAEHLDERRALESDGHWLAVVLAGHALGCGLREVIVLGVQLQGRALHMEAYQVARIVGKGLHAAERCQQSETVGAQFVGVVLRDDAVIVGVTPFDEPAEDDAIAIVQLSVALVEAYDHVATIFTQQVAQQVSGLFRQDEGSRLLALDGVYLVAHESRVSGRSRYHSSRGEARLEPLQISSG